MRYALHGLIVESDLPIAAAPALSGSGADITIASRIENVPDAAPDGDLLAGDGEGRWYSLVRTGDAFVIDVPNLCRFHIDHSLSQVACLIAPAADPGMAAILAGGNLIASILGLRGIGVLHASTVAFGGRAIAIAGASGMGKSTVAALLCEAGALLVGDDVLRVDDSLRCLPGSTQIRLRPQAQALAAAFASAAATPDERVAVTPRVATGAPSLAAVLLPRPARSIDAVALRTLTGAEAAAELLRCARIMGWRDRTALQAQFDLATHVASAVPVVEAAVPWGPPFSPGIADALREVAQG